MNIQEVIQSQYLASLAMMKQAIELCPTAMWDDRTVEESLLACGLSWHCFLSIFICSQRNSDFVYWEKASAPL